MRVSYRQLREVGACSAGIRRRFPELRKAGIEIPRRYSEFSIDVADLMRATSLSMMADLDDWLPMDSRWTRACFIVLARHKLAAVPGDMSVMSQALDAAEAYVRGVATGNELLSAQACIAHLSEVAGYNTWAAVYHATALYLRVYSLSCHHGYVIDGPEKQKMYEEFIRLLSFPEDVFGGPNSEPDGFDFKKA